MLIEDGKGSGYKAEVNSDNELIVHATAHTEIHARADEGDAYVWTGSKNIDATDCILWLRNDSTTKELVIEEIIVSTDAAGSFFIYCPEDTTADGDTITGVNLNRSSGEVALATCRTDATGTTPANYIHYGHAPADTNVLIDFHGSLSLGYLNEVAIDITDEPGLAQATIIGYYQPR